MSIVYISSGGYLPILNFLDVFVFFMIAYVIKNYWLIMLMYQQRSLSSLLCNDCIAKDAEYVQ